MTDRLTALEELKAKVEVGEVVDENGLAIRTDVADLSDLVFGPELIFPFVDAFEGSIDAAMTLKDATLPGWRIHRIGQRHGGVWEAVLLQVGEDGWHVPENGHKRVSIFNECRARALLLADLSALIEQEKADG